MSYVSLSINGDLEWVLVIVLHWNKSLKKLWLRKILRHNLVSKVWRWCNCDLEMWLRIRDRHEFPPSLYFTPLFSTTFQEICFQGKTGILHILFVFHLYQWQFDDLTFSKKNIFDAFQQLNCIKRFPRVGLC